MKLLAMVYKLSHLIVFMFFFFGAFAQKMTLEECIRTAWENNISVQQSILSEGSARINVDRSKAAIYPNLSAGSSLSISGRSVDPTNNEFASSSFYTNNYNLSSNVLLYNGGQLRKSIQRAKKGEQAARFQREEVQQNIAIQVANAYLRVLFNEENLAIAEKRLDITQQQITELSKLIEAGLRPKNAIFELEATQASNQQAVVTAEGNVALSRLQLKQLMLIPADKEYELEVPDILVASLEDPFLLDPESLYKKAIERQPGAKNADIQRQMAELDKAIAKSAYYPRLGLGGSVGTNYSSLGKEVTGTKTVVANQDVIINGTNATIGIPNQVPIFSNKSYLAQVTDNITYGYGFSLSIPIYSNRQIKSSVSQAEIGRMNAELQQQQWENQFRAQIEQAVLDARNAKKQYEAASKSVAASQKAMENIKQSFDAGGADTFQLNIATTQYDTALLQSVIAKYDYLFRMKIIDFYLGKPLNL